MFDEAAARRRMVEWIAEPTARLGAISQDAINASQPVVGRHGAAIDQSAQDENRLCDAVQHCAEKLKPQ